MPIQHNTYPLKKKECGRRHRQVQREDGVKTGEELMVYKPRILSKPLMLDFQSPELSGNNFLLFKPASLEYFGIATLAECSNTE